MKYTSNFVQNKSVFISLFGLLVNMSVTSPKKKAFFSLFDLNVSAPSPKKKRFYFAIWLKCVLVYPGGKKLLGFPALLENNKILHPSRITPGAGQISTYYCIPDIMHIHFFCML